MREHELCKMMIYPLNTLYTDTLYIADDDRRVILFSVFCTFKAIIQTSENTKRGVI